MVTSGRSRQWGEDSVSRINADTRIIALDTPNNNTLSPGWGTFKTTVDAIEKATGYDLLSNVPEAVQKVMEPQVESGPAR